MANKKAKVGDYVKVIKKLPYKDQMNVDIGDIGVVNYIAGTGKYSVHIDGKKNPHDDDPLQRLRVYGKKYDFWIPFECCEVVKLDKQVTEELTKKCLFENADAFDEISIYNDVPEDIKELVEIGIYTKEEVLANMTIINKESEESKMKEIKNQKVVDLYFSRKEEEINKRYTETREELFKIDKNQIFIDELKKQYTDYYEANKDEISFLTGKFDIMLPLTEETKLKNIENDNLFKKEIDQLNEVKEEIIALLSGCETYEQEMEILHTYKIVNYNSHYVNMNKIGEETN